MVAESLRNVSGRGQVAHGEQQGDRGDGADRAHSRQNARSPADPASSRDHGGPEQQGKSGVTGHGVILLRGRKGEEHQNEPSPAESQQTRAAGPIQRLKGEFGDRGEVHAPREKPNEVKKPEVEARHRVVIARIA